MKKLSCTKYLLIASLLVFVVAASTTTAAAETQIAYFDVQEVAGMHPAVQDAMEELQAEEQQMMQEMDAMDEEEQMMQQQAMQQQLQALQEQLFDEAFDALEDDIQNIAEEKGYDYVLEENALFAGGDDITDEVVEYIADQYDVEEEPEEDLFEVEN